MQQLLVLTNHCSRKMMQANKASPGLMRTLKIDKLADWQ